VWSYEVRAQNHRDKHLTSDVCYYHVHLSLLINHCGLNGLTYLRNSVITLLQVYLGKSGTLTTIKALKQRPIWQSYREIKGVIFASHIVDTTDIAYKNLT